MKTIYSDSSIGCIDVAEKAESYIRHLLPESETIGIEEHLRTCGDCRELLSTLGLVNEFAGAAFPAAAIPRGYMPYLRIRERLSRKFGIARRAGLQAIRFAPALGAAIIVFILTFRTAVPPEYRNTLESATLQDAVNSLQGDQRTTMQLHTARTLSSADPGTGVSADVIAANSEPVTIHELADAVITSMKDEDVSTLTAETVRSNPDLPNP